MAGASRQVPRILVAEPDAQARQKIVSIVREVAAELSTEVVVDQANSGTTALAAISDHRPAIMIAEILLEGLSGLELLRRIQADSRAKTAVVFVTSMIRETDRYWGLRNGAHAYLPKPYDEARLRDTIKALLQRGTEAQPEPIG